MQTKVLVIESSQKGLQLVSKLVRKAGLIPVGVSSLTEAQVRFSLSTPEEYLCAVVAYSLPDAPHGEAIDFTISAFMPTIVVTDRADAETRKAILGREIVDYLVKDNHQIYDYLSRLLARLDKNKSIGVLVVDDKRKSRTAMASLLRRHNFLVYSANGQDEAMAYLSDNPHIQLMLVDYSIDGNEGIHFIAKLRRAYSKEEMAIIGIAEDRTGLLPATFLKSGANDFLRSPFCHEEFLCRVMQNLELLENVETLRRVANSDYLTGLPNRRHFFFTIATQYRQQADNQALALIDLDHFKSVNDTYGHDAGDAVLKTVAELIASLFSDVPVARFGGEEFCVYLPFQSAQEAQKRVEDFRLLVSETPVLYKDKLLSITSSIGLVFTHGENIETLLTEADKLLYKAKSSGRNQVCARSI